MSAHRSAPWPLYAGVVVMLSGAAVFRLFGTPAVIAFLTGEAAGYAITAFLQRRCGLAWHRHGGWGAGIRSQVFGYRTPWGALHGAWRLRRLDRHRTAAVTHSHFPGQGILYDDTTRTWRSRCGLCRSPIYRPNFTRSHWSAVSERNGGQ